MAAKAALEQFDVILTAGPKGLDSEDEKLLNTLRSPKKALEPESVGFPFVSHHNFSVPWKAEGEILQHFVLGILFSFSLFPLPFGWLPRTREYKPFASTRWTFRGPWPKN